jgi:hypothetical protein
MTPLSLGLFTTLEGAGGKFIKAKWPGCSG